MGSRTERALFPFFLSLVSHTMGGTPGLARSRRWELDATSRIGLLKSTDLPKSREAISLPAGQTAGGAPAPHRWAPAPHRHKTEQSQPAGFARLRAALLCVSSATAAVCWRREAGGAECVSVPHGLIGWRREGGQRTEAAGLRVSALLLACFHCCLHASRISPRPLVMTHK